MKITDPGYEFYKRGYDAGAADRRYHMDAINRIAKCVGGLGETSERVAELVEESVGWKCQARRTADPPQDCDWPTCGCDPKATRVIEFLQESGRILVVV